MTFPCDSRSRGTYLSLARWNGETESHCSGLPGLFRSGTCCFCSGISPNRREADKWIAEVADGDLVTIVAWEGEAVLGYASYARGNARWTRHVAELRVVVAESARSLGIGKLLLELVFEMALGEGVTKVVAGTTPDQAGAQRLFKKVLGFEQEAVFGDHAMCADGLTCDLLLWSFQTRLNQDQRCSSCGCWCCPRPPLDGTTLCSHCFEIQYEELGGWAVRHGRRRGPGRVHLRGTRSTRRDLVREPASYSSACRVNAVQVNSCATVCRRNAVHLDGATTAASRVSSLMPTA